MGPTEITGVLSSIKSAKDILEAMVGLRDAATFQAKRLELQSKLLDAQSKALAANEDRAALVDRISELEHQIARFKKWEAEKQRYELKRWGDAAFAYVLKEDAANGQPLHALCTTCYDNGKKTLLQSNGEMQIHSHAWNCPVCKTSVRAHARILPKTSPTT